MKRKAPLQLLKKGERQCPRQLSAAAQKEWKRLLPILEPQGLLPMPQGLLAGFEMYCAARARWLEAEKAVKDSGMVVKAPSGYPVQNPYLAIANKAMEQMRQFLDELDAIRARTGEPPKNKPLSAVFPLGNHAVE